MTPLSDWYHVRFDDRAVYRDVAPPDRDPWSDEVPWADIVRVCYRTGNMFESDEIYLFTSTRAESYLIPTEADGGSQLVGELIHRDLFAAELILEAVTTEGELFCWPPAEGGRG